MMDSVVHLNIMNRSYKFDTPLTPTNSVGHLHSTKKIWVICILCPVTTPSLVVGPCVWAHMDTHTRIHAYIHTHTRMQYTHKHTHTRVHTHTHTHSHRLKVWNALHRGCENAQVLHSCFVAACCSVLQRVAACCSVLSSRTLRHFIGLYCSLLWCVVVCCSVLWCVVACCSVL